LQVLRLGAPVTALSLSPAMDLLATAHAGRRGLYLWANALVYGRGAEAVPSEAPLDARLPALAAGAPRARPTRPLRRAPKQAGRARADAHYLISTLRPPRAAILVQRYRLSYTRARSMRVSCACVVGSRQRRGRGS